MTSRNTLGRKAVLCAVAATLGAVFQTQATTINLTFDTSQGNLPSFDPDASKLEVLANAARAKWLNLLPESGHNYSVSVHYGPLGGNTLGLYNDFDHTITIDNDGSEQWYLDSDPTTDTEFGTFQQILYRGLPSGPDKSSLHGDVPSLLEVGYKAKAANNTPAGQGVDMLSVLTHEMGHFCEIGYNLLKPQVDLQPQFIGNHANVKEDRADESHIFMSMALMDPTTATGERTLPSELDAIVAAHEQGHSQIHLKRTDWIGDAANPVINQWFWGPGWVGGAEPGFDTEVNVREGADLVIITPAVAQSLVVSEKSHLTQLSTLSVGLDAQIVGNGAFDHCGVNVGASTFDVSRNLTVDLADVTLAGGTLEVIGTLKTNASFTNVGNFSEIKGYGTVHVGTALNNIGDLRADGGTLKINVNPGVKVDLDGDDENNDRGALFAQTGDLEINAPLTDGFGGTMEVWGGHSAKFGGDVAFEFPAHLNFDKPGDAILATTGAGAAINIDGGFIHVDAGRTHFQADHIQWNRNNKLVQVTVATGATLSLEGAIEYDGGDFLSFQDDGTIQQNGDATVVGDVTMGVGHYDWDGAGIPPTKTTIDDNGKFIINAKDLGPGGYSGQTDIGKGAELSVNVTGGFGIWQLNSGGKIRLLQNSHISGSPIAVNGRIDVVKGGNHIDTTAILNATSLITINDTAILNFNKPVNYDGGVITTSTGNVDDSSLEQFDGAGVSGHQHITVGYFDWDGSSSTASDTTISSTGFFDIHAKEIGNGITDPFLLLFDRRGFGDTINNEGRLEVHVGFEQPGNPFPQQWEINKGGQLFMNAGAHAPPTVAGSKLVNNGLISGVGVFENQLTNQNMIEVGHASGIGQLKVMDIFSQDPSGAIAFDLGGGEAGITFDQLYLDVGGSLHGELDVSLLPGFVPSVGEVFRIIDGGNLAQINGTFDTLDLPSGAWDVIYGKNFVDLRVTAVPEPALAIVALSALVLRSGRRARKAQ